MRKKWTGNCRWRKEESGKSGEKENGEKTAKNGSKKFKKKFFKKIQKNTCIFLKGAI